MKCRCPVCGRYGMCWDARARILLCYYYDCMHVIRLSNKDAAPTQEEITAAIIKDAQSIRSDTFTNVVLTG